MDLIFILRVRGYVSSSDMIESRAVWLRNTFGSTRLFLTVGDDRVKESFVILSGPLTDPLLRRSWDLP